MNGQLDFFPDRDPMQSAYELAMQGLREVLSPEVLRDRLTLYSEYERLGYSVSGLERNERDGQA